MKYLHERGIVMKRTVCIIISLILIVMSVSALADVKIDKKHFPDSNFREYIKENIDTNKDGKLSKTEINQTVRILISRWQITSLKGIEIFTSLFALECRDNSITELNLSKNKMLEHLDCSNNKITKLNIKKNSKLITCYCQNNNLTKLDVSKNNKLSTLCCEDNKIKKLNISKCKKLVRLVNRFEPEHSGLSGQGNYLWKGAGAYLRIDDTTELIK